MRKLLGQLWRDDRGSVLAMEWVFVASILTLGAIAGMFAMQASSEDSGPDWPAALTR